MFKFSLWVLIGISFFHMLPYNYSESNCFVLTSFVRAAVEYYYPSDADVSKDTELQDWICEIFIYGLLRNYGSGI